MTDANPKRAWWLVAAGLVVGGAVGAAAFRQPAAEPPAAESADAIQFTVNVVVAAKDLPVGTLVDAGAVESKAVPHSQRPAKYVGLEDAAVGRRLSRAYRAGEAFHPDDLSRDPCGLSIPPGQHMYSVSIECPVARAGLVEPGARVDVMATVRIGGAARTVLAFQDALVLSADTLATSFPPVPLFSFAVSRKQALILELARAKGAVLSLAAVAPDANPRPPQDLDATINLFSDAPDDKPAVAVPPGLVLPKGTQALAMEFPPNGLGGFIVPGGRVDVLATVRADGKLKAFPVAVNLLVVAVDTLSEPNKGITKLTVTFAVGKDQAAVLALAKDRGCVLSPILRNPADGDKNDGYDIKKVTELLSGLPSATAPVAPPPRAK